MKKIIFVKRNGKIDLIETIKLNRKPRTSLKDTVERRRRQQRDARIAKMF